jgi:hypothetical protein
MERAKFLNVRIAGRIITAISKQFIVNIQCALFRAAYSSYGGLHSGVQIHDDSERPLRQCNRHNPIIVSGSNRQLDRRGEMLRKRGKSLLGPFPKFEYLTPPSIEIPFVRLTAATPSDAPRPVAFRESPRRQSGAMPRSAGAARNFARCFQASPSLAAHRAA